MSSALSMVPLLHQDTVGSPTRTRHQFNTAYKLQILAAAAACLKPGELGALLRREELFSPHGEPPERRGELRGPAKRRGPVPTPADPAIKRIAALERELAKATARAERAELIIDAQKKFSQLLGLTLPTAAAPTETRS